MQLTNYCMSISSSETQPVGTCIVKIAEMSLVNHPLRAELSTSMPCIFLSHFRWLLGHSQYRYYLQEGRIAAYDCMVRSASKHQNQWALVELCD